MSRKIRRVPITLDAGDVKQLSEDEIRLILRGADELIMSGGRGLLAKVLKGSRQQAVLENELSLSPVYGALSEFSLEQITARVDWLIINGYLRIDYDHRLPLLVYTKRGWAIERETYADELLGRLDRALSDGNAILDLNWLIEKNPELLRIVLVKIANTGDPKYLPVLKRWQKKASRRMACHILEAARVLKQNGS